MKKELRDRAWKIANSNLILLIVGSGVLTGISAYISYLIQERQARLETRKQVVRFVTELDYRLTMLQDNKDNFDAAYVRFLDDDGYVTVKDNGWNSKSGRAYMWREIVLENIKESTTSYDAIVAGIAPYHPTEKTFDQQNLVSIVSWFNFNLETEVEIDKEIDAAKFVATRHGYGVVKEDSALDASLKTLHEFAEKVKLQLHDGVTLAKTIK